MQAAQRAANEAVVHGSKEIAAELAALEQDLVTFNPGRISNNELVELVVAKFSDKYSEEALNIFRDLCTDKYESRLFKWDTLSLSALIRVALVRRRNFLKNGDQNASK